MEQALRSARKNVLLTGLNGLRPIRPLSTKPLLQTRRYIFYSSTVHSSKFTLQNSQHNNSISSRKNHSNGPQNGFEPDPQNLPQNQLQNKTLQNQPQNNISPQNVAPLSGDYAKNPTDLADLEELVCADQANSIRADLAENEQTGSINEKSKRNRKYKGVVQFWSNYIASNTPIEDRRVGLRNSIRKRSSRSNHVRTIYSEEKSYLFGVLDGHGGGQCADVVSKRIGDYYMTTQVPEDEIRNYLVIANQQVSGTTFAPRLLPYRSRNLFNDRVAGDHTYPRSVNVFNDIWPMWRDSLHKFAHDIATGEVKISDDRDAVREAIMRLDNDILGEAYRYGSRDVSTIWGNLSSAVRQFFRDVARSGSVGSLVLIKQGLLTLGHLGDTRAVLGRKIDNSWAADKISEEHNHNKVRERNRMHSEHPSEEQDSIFIDGRVLGVLQPTRAFGNSRLKVKKRILEEMFKGDKNYQTFFNYKTPPYVSNEPLMKTIALSPDLRFMIVASDGFWENFDSYFNEVDTFPTESLSEEEQKVRHDRTEQGVIEIIGKHLDALEILNGMEGEYERSRFKAIHGLENNVATNIIKNCLMINEFGDYSRFNLIDTLSLHPSERRIKRDDITCTIVLFG